MTEKDIELRLERHKESERKQHALYHHYKTLESTSLEALDAKERVKELAEFNADTISLLHLIEEQPLAEEVLRLRYITGLTVPVVACRLYITTSWVYRLCKLGIAEIKRKGGSDTIGN